jgi:hypothetical protein
MASPATLSRQEATKIIRDFLDEGGVCEQTLHLWDREEMRGVTHRDVELAIYRGTATCDPYVNPEYDNWELKISAEIDGKTIVLGVAIDDDGTIRRRRTVTITTVFSKDK